MTYKIVCKKVELAESSKEKLLKKIHKLDKFFEDDTECRIGVSQQKEQMIVEITIIYKGFFFRAEARNRELLSAADECLANLDRQIRKNKTRLSKKIHEAGFENYDLGFNDATPVKEEEEFHIIKKKHVSAKPMMVEEAILQMNMLGHDFFVFSNPETMDMSVVYRRKDGNYGLIEAD